MKEFEIYKQDDIYVILIPKIGLYCPERRGAHINYSNYWLYSIYIQSRNKAVEPFKVTFNVKHRV